MGRGDGLPARADLPDEASRRRARSAWRARSPRTSTAASAAWRASRRARRACSTTGCWRPTPPAAGARGRARQRTTSCSATRSSRCSRTSGGCARPPLPGGLYQALRKIPAIRALAERLPRQAGGDGVAAAAGLGARRVRPPARAHPRRRAPPRPGRRCSPAACRTCSSTASTRPPCGCSPPRAGTCSCPATSSAAARWSSTPAARSPRWPGPGARSASTCDLDVDYVVTNVAGCGSSMKEYGHLLDDDAGVGRARAGVQRAGARRARGAGRGRAARPAPPGARPRRLPRRLPPRARAEGAGATPRRCCAHPRRRAARPAGGGAVLRLGGHLQHGRARGGGRARRAQGGEHPRRPGPTSSSPPTRAACCRSASTSASTCRCCTRCSCSTRASAVCVPSTAHRDQRLPDRVTARTLPGMSGMSLAAYQQQPDAIGGSLGPVRTGLAAATGGRTGAARRVQGARPVGRAGGARDRVAGRDTGVRHARGHGGDGRAARGVLRPVPDHVDRGQRVVDLQHDGGDRPLRRAAPQLRRVLGGPAHAGDPHRVLLRRPPGGARRASARRSRSRR